MNLDKQSAKDKIEKMINEGKLHAVDQVFDFLLYCLPFGDLEELLQYAKSEKELYLKMQKEKEEKSHAEWIESNRIMNESRFTWDEMIEILGEIGGIVTFNPVGNTTLFSRYNIDGYLISTIGLSYYAPLDRIPEEKLSKYRDLIYTIDGFHSKWNCLKIAKYLKERELNLLTKVK